MIHPVMEIDSRSSSFSPSKVRGPSGLRHKPMMNTMKRARSPESAQLLEEDRPSKRCASGLFVDASVRPGSLSAAGSRQPSEDWVQQAGGLKLDSPIFPLGAQFMTTGMPHQRFGEANTAQTDSDIDMSMDDANGISTGHLNSEQFQSQTLNLPSYLYPATLGPSTLARELQISNPSPSYGAPFSHTFSTSQNATTTPLKNVLPSISPSLPSLQLMEHHIVNESRPHPLHAELFVPSPGSIQLPTSPSSEATPMPISPQPSFISASSFVKTDETKKRVVKFGPRTNCPMCKQGVPHFAHYDYE
ncbi:hypothetical protein CPB83DRAFT_902836 [Crepidotus variabilis]|uniref:Uncharacterized protein n=1 Tax=Crepidotus variabilis TaxID=179855 RepID=A0A9P6JUH6_9AGAR|nr:hypothetical protein CPB83DRAFT_902836 [Crepidotus variabilis]